MIVMLILRNFQQAKLGSLQRKWKVPRQLHVISSKWLVTHKLHKSSYTSTQKSHQENTRRENLLSNQNNQVTRMLFMRIPKHQALTRRVLILRTYTKIRIGVQSVEIQPMWKDFSGLQRNSNVKLVTSLDISLVFVIKRSKHHSSLEDHRLINYK